MLSCYLKRIFFFLFLVHYGCAKDDFTVNIDHIRIIAHRGVSSYAPENSLKAIERSLVEKVDAVEFDIQLSQDGEIMVFHDEYLFRMTGQGGRISNHVKGELKYMHLKDQNGHFSEETIPTLKDVFDAVGSQTDYYIEIKHPSQEIEHKLINLILAYNLSEKVSILSVDNKSLQRIAAMEAGVKLRLLFYDDSSPLLLANNRNDQLKHIHGVIIPCGIVNMQLLKKLHESFEAIDVYTVNSVSDLEQEAYLYIQGIITDYPEKWISLKPH